MQPGDVLLVTGTTLVSRMVTKTQEHGGFHPDHARWTHVGLYIGRDRLVEATPFGGVRVGLLSRMTFGRELLVRRSADTGLMDIDRYEIAVAALTNLRRGYSLSVVPRLAMQAFRRRLWSDRIRPYVPSVTICSTVVSDSYMSAVYKNLLPGVVGVTWPADLSQTPELVDVRIGWARVVA